MKAGYWRYCKRVSDVFFALLLLIPIAVIVPCAAMAIKLDSDGPVLFKQRRVGRNNKIFTIYKLRTMRSGVAATDKKSLDRSQITRVGRVLRIASIDELPQIMNVLKGDMSFVGPRPLITKEVEVIASRAWGGAHRVRPGITGLAQISGRDRVSDVDKVKLDSEYAENVSLGLDMKCVLLTFAHVLMAKDSAEVAANKTTSYSMMTSGAHGQKG